MYRVKHARQGHAVSSDDAKVNCAVAQARARLMEFAGSSMIGTFNQRFSATCQDLESQDPEVDVDPRGIRLGYQRHIAEPAAVRRAAEECRQRVRSRILCAFVRYDRPEHHIQKEPRHLPKRLHNQAEHDHAARRYIGDGIPRHIRPHEDD